MSGPGDYGSEMFRRGHIDDTAIEDLFTGNGAGEELASLVVVAEELRGMARGSVPTPSAQLAAMLAQGFSTEKGDAPATAGSNVYGPATAQAAGLPKWRTRRMAVAEFLTGLSLAAKVALGAGVAAASVTAAGAANVLPAPAQNVVASTVEAVTPFSFPDKANEHADFGRRVSTDARDGGVDGSVISDEARRNGEAHRADGAGSGQPADPGQNGLDRAGTTPASGHVPTSLPAPGHGATGADRAGETPAADHVPSSVPARPTTTTTTEVESSGGGTTPDDVPPVSVPGGRP